MHRSDDVLHSVWGALLHIQVDASLAMEDKCPRTSTHRDHRLGSG